MQKHTGDIHPPSNTVHGHHCAHHWLLKKKKIKKNYFVFAKYTVTTWYRVYVFVRILDVEHQKKRRKINFCATNKMQEKAGGKAEEAHFSYITPHKRFTLTNAEVDRRDPIIIRLPAVGSLSGCCIFPSQMLTRSTSTARRIAKCQSFPQPPPPWTHSRYNCGSLICFQGDYWLSGDGMLSWKFYCFSTASVSHLSCVHANEPLWSACAWSYSTKQIDDVY